MSTQSSDVASKSTRSHGKGEKRIPVPKSVAATPKVSKSIQREAIAIKNGLLFYKTKTITDWVQMVSSAASIRVGAGYESISDIVLDGNIKILQRGAVNSPLEGLAWSTKFMWRQYKDVHVQEFKQDGRDTMVHVAVQFKVKEAPSGEQVIPPTWDEFRKRKLENRTAAQEDNDQTGIQTEAAVQSSEASPSTHEIVAHASDLPLARLANRFDEDGFTDLLLVFARPRFALKGNRVWNWEAAITFLSGKEVWTSPDTKDATLAQNQLSLDDIAQALENCPSEQAKLSKTDLGYWVLRQFSDGTRMIAMDIPKHAPSALPSEAFIVTPLDQVKTENQVALDSRKRKLEELAEARKRLDEEEMELKADVETMEKKHKSGE